MKDIYLNINGIDFEYVDVVNEVEPEERINEVNAANEEIVENAAILFPRMRLQRRGRNREEIVVPNFDFDDELDDDADEEMWINVDQRREVVNRGRHNVVPVDAVPNRVRNVFENENRRRRAEFIEFQQANMGRFYIHLRGRRQIQDHLANLQVAFMQNANVRRPQPEPVVIFRDRINESTTKLTLNGKNESNVVKKIISIFPNLTTLKV